MIDHRAPGAGDVFGADDLPEIGILQRIGCQLGQLPRRCMVGLPVQTVRVFKMRVCKPQRLGFVVHRLHKGFLSAALARNRKRRVVSTHQHESIQGVPNADRLPRFEVHGRALGLGVLRFDRVCSVNVSLFDGDNGGHNLGG